MHPTGLPVVITAIFLLLLSAQLCDGKSKKTKRKKPKKPPHIVFILADDYGYHDIGYHGSLINTPVLDQLAAEGVKLENYYVQPSCTPTRSQLLTGRYQIHTGMQHTSVVPDRPVCLPLNEVTLPQRLKQYNYSTHLVGKWHLGFYKRECMPLQRGFDTHFGLLTGFAGYFSHYHYHKGRSGYDFRKNGKVDFSYYMQYATFLYRDRAKQIISRHNKKKSLFLMLSFQAPHEPLEPPVSYLLRYHNATNPKWRKLAGVVSIMDEVVGDVVDALKAKNIWKDTVLIFSSDNGGIGVGRNWPLRGRKGTLWEGGIRGIGFVSGPTIPEHMRGTINNELIHVSDWLPTLLEGVAGGSSRDLSLDGVNQWETIKYQSPSRRDSILHNIDPIRSHAKRNNGTRIKYVNEDSVFHTGMTSAIRVGNWKLITGEPGEGKWLPPIEYDVESFSEEPKSINEDGKQIWLFNISADPYERNEISGENPKVVAELLQKLEDHYKTSVPVYFPDREPLIANPNKNDGNWGPWDRKRKEREKHLEYKAAKLASRKERLMAKLEKKRLSRKHKILKDNATKPERKPLKKPEKNSEERKRVSAKRILTKLDSLIEMNDY